MTTAPQSVPTRRILDANVSLPEGIPENTVKGIRTLVENSLRYNSDLRADVLRDAEYSVTPLIAYMKKGQDFDRLMSGFEEHARTVVRYILSQIRTTAPMAAA